jgi:hypothetical protein
MATLPVVDLVTPFDADLVFPDGYTSLVCSGITTTLNTDISAVFSLPYFSLASKAKLIVVATAFTGTSVTVSYCESPDGVNFAAASTLVSAAVAATGTTSGAVIATGGLMSTGHFTFTGTFTTATLSIYLATWNR